MVPPDIIKATESHIEELSRLFSAYRDFYRMETDLEGCKSFLTERIENGDSEIYIHINEEGSQTGFVQLYPLFSSTRMAKFWLLNDLFVHPDYRGRGISKKLIDVAKELCRNTRACGMMLETEKSNDIGNNLYPKTGFKLDTKHNFYTWDV
ncbi:GNAT family N-acetyltransferase [Gracilimonas sp. BCB1]|uniref:GNAT family N-acetyltransferase n=1 Tax=Gracilimonas sp. BCB1 TaxID=3152362 RepID=UPI0032D9801B